MTIAAQQHDVPVLVFLPIVRGSEAEQQATASAEPTSLDEQHDVSTASASASEVDSTEGVAIGDLVHSANSSRVGNRPAERILIRRAEPFAHSMTAPSQATGSGIGGKSVRDSCWGFCASSLSIVNP